MSKIREDMDVCELELPARAMRALKLSQIYYIKDRAF